MTDADCRLVLEKVATILQTRMPERTAKAPVERDYALEFFENTMVRRLETLVEIEASSRDLARCLERFANITS